MTTDSIANTLARSSLLRDLAEEDLAQIATFAFRRVYRRGEVVMHQGDPGDALHIVEKGRLKVFVYGESGSETLLSIVGPGECFGELALLDGEPRSANVQALEAAETVLVRRSDFLGLLRAHPETTVRLLTALTTKIRQLTDTVSDLAFLDLEGRLAKRLLELSEHYGSDVDGAAQIEVPLTQEDLAAMVGATRASVNKLLGWYEDRHLIARNGRRITITDPDRLRRRIT